MKSSKLNWAEILHSRARSVASASLTLVALGFVFFYILHSYEAYLSSDAAVANILASEIKRSGTFFPKDWWYVNGDLWILFKHVLVLPWAIMGENNFSAHAFSVFGGSIFLLSAAFFMLRSVGGTYSQALLGVAIICLGYSDHYLDAIFGEAAYSWTAAMIMWLVALLTRMERALANDSKYNGSWLWLPLLFYSFAVANPIRFLAFTLVPLVTALVLARQATSTSMSAQKPRRHLLVRFLTYVVTAIAALALATLTHHQLLSGLSNIEGASAATLIALDQLPAALAYSVLGLMSVLGVDWVPGTRLASIAGLMALAKMATYPAFFVAPFLILLRKRMTLNFGQRLIGFTGFAGLFSITFLVASTSLQGGEPVAAIYTTRYVAPYILIILVSCICFWEQHSRTMKALLTVAFLLATLSSWGHMSPKGFREQERLPNAANIGYSFAPGWQARVAKRQRVVKGLTDAGLKYGYAPYWHSHAYTVLSGGRLEIRPIHMNQGDLRPWLHLSSSSWYKTGYADDNVFLLLPSTEVEAVMSNLSASCSIQPRKTLKIEDYTVLVFDSNPLLAVATRNLEAKGIFCLSPRSLRQIGNYDPERQGIQSLKSHGSGFLHYGPYQSLVRGHYLVSFDINVTNEPSDRTASLGYVEVTAKSGSLNLGKAEISPASSVLSIPWTIDTPALEQIEFRVFSSGNADILLRRIEVSQATAPNPIN